MNHILKMRIFLREYSKDSLRFVSDRNNRVLFKSRSSTQNLQISAPLLNPLEPPWIDFCFQVVEEFDNQARQTVCTLICLITFNQVISEYILIMLAVETASGNI